MDKIEIKIKKNGEVYIEGEAIDDFNCKEITEKILKKIFSNLEKYLRPKEVKEYGKLYYFERENNNDK